jgi:hypothetical protein
MISWRVPGLQRAPVYSASDRNNPERRRAVIGSTVAVGSF